MSVKISSNVEQLDTFTKEILYKKTRKSTTLKAYVNNLCTVDLNVSQFEKHVSLTNIERQFFPIWNRLFKAFWKNNFQHRTHTHLSERFRNTSTQQYLSFANVQHFSSISWGEIKGKLLYGNVHAQKILKCRIFPTLLRTDPAANVT